MLMLGVAVTLSALVLYVGLCSSTPSRRRSAWRARGAATMRAEFKGMVLRSAEVQQMRRSGSGAVGDGKAQARIDETLGHGEDDDESHPSREGNREIGT